MHESFVTTGEGAGASSRDLLDEKSKSLLFPMVGGALLQMTGALQFDGKGLLTIQAQLRNQVSNLKRNELNSFSVLTSLSRTWSIEMPSYELRWPT